MESEEKSGVSKSSLESCDEEDDFYFETENLALKGNKDYLKQLRTLCVLESQRFQALKVVCKINTNVVCHGIDLPNTFYYFQSLVKFINYL